jgi:hypothetical protein
MPRKLQTVFPKGREKTICAIGDSLTFNEQYAVLMDEFYPEQLAVQLRTVGCDVKARNFGYAGDDTTGILRRIRTMLRFEIPDLAIIMAGVNDPGDGRTASSLTRSGTTATFTASSAHSLSTGDVVVISGSNLSPYNVSKAVVTVTSSTVFTYQMASDPGGTSAGTPRFDHLTQGNIEAMIIALRNNVSGVVGSQTLLPSGVPPGTRYLVRYDTSTTGGVPTGSSGITPATLIGMAATDAQVWIARNTSVSSSSSGESGWSRVANDNTLGVQRIIVMSAQWVHRADGLGDLKNLDYSTYVAVRAAQLAAATAQAAAGVVTFFDLHAYQKALVVANYVGELTGEWAATTNDQHPSAFAGYTWAKGLVGHIQSQSGWITALS